MIRKPDFQVLSVCLFAIAGFLASCAPSTAPPPTSSTPPPTASPTTTPNPTVTPTPSPSASPTTTLTASITPTPTLLPGAAPTFPPGRVTLITNGDREKPFVALTFDVGENPKKPAGFDDGIEQALIANAAPATFFMGGHWMLRHPDITRRLALNPLFELGNHSWSHPDFRLLTQAELSSEIIQTNDMLYQLTGLTTRLFRLPSGTYNDLALGIVAYHGMLTIQWDVVTADPVPDNDAENIVRIVMQRVQNGSIIVMHANGRGWHTAEALPEMIAQLRAAGYTLVTVSELLGLK